MQAYDPLDYDNLAKSVVQALLDTPKVSLPPHESFQGAGVYAVYYLTTIAPSLQRIRARQST